MGKHMIDDREGVDRAQRRKIARTGQYRDKTMAHVGDGSHVGLLPPNENIEQDCTSLYLPHNC